MQRPSSLPAPPGTLWLLRRSRPPPDPELFPCHQSQAQVVPIILTGGPWHPPCATVGILSPGHCAQHSLVHYCHYGRFCHHGPWPHQNPQGGYGQPVPIMVTLSLLLQPYCPHQSHSVLSSATTATLSPHSPVAACHHSHCVSTTATPLSPQPLQSSCVTLSSQSPCPHVSHNSHAV